MAYFAADSFPELLKTSGYGANNSLSFYHLNAQRLRNKSEEVEAEIEHMNFTFDFIAFTKTWFRSEGDAIELPGYKHITEFRKDKRGGGDLVHAQKLIF